MEESGAGGIAPGLFRQVLGRYPTGLAVVTAVDGGEPLGMVVGSFTSVSLEPPLVAYLPAKSSQSYQRLQGIDRFCVNVLSVEQERICRQFAARGIDKYAGVDWWSAPSGSPILDGTVAWIDCEVESVTDAGDHDIVVGRVRALGPGAGSSPMLFFQGGYGGFNARSLVAGSGTGLRRQLQSAELARGPMEALAEEAGIPCYAQVVVDGDLLVVAAAGPQGQSVGTHIGSRLPLQPPYGSLFCVGEDLPAAVRRWTANIGKVADDERETLRSVLETVRGRGWSVGLVAPRHEEIWQEVGRLADVAPTPANDARLAELLTPLRAYYDPREFPDQPVDLRILAAPVVVDGATTMVVALHGFTEPLSVDALAPYLAALDRTASRIGDRISQRMDAAVS